jgi:hypothetical protein
MIISITSRGFRQVERDEERRLFRKFISKDVFGNAINNASFFPYPPRIIAMHLPPRLQCSNPFILATPGFKENLLDSPKRMKIFMAPWEDGPEVLLLVVKEEGRGRKRTPLLVFQFLITAIGKRLIGWSWPHLMTWFQVLQRMVTSKTDRGNEPGWSKRQHFQVFLPATLLGIQSSPAGGAGALIYALFRVCVAVVVAVPPKSLLPRRCVNGASWREVGARDARGDLGIVQPWVRGSTLSSSL